MILSSEVWYMQIIPLHQNDRVQLKKPHPCGGRIFRLLRIGSEVRICCESCGRDMTIDRIKLEKAIKQVLPTESGTAHEST
jgi:hypothetical protein